MEESELLRKIHSIAPGGSFGDETLGAHNEYVPSKVPAEVTMRSELENEPTMSRNADVV